MPVDRPLWAEGGEFDQGWTPRVLRDTCGNVVVMHLECRNGQRMVIDEAGTLYPVFEGYLDGRHSFPLNKPRVAASFANLMVEAFGGVRG